MPVTTPTSTGCLESPDSLPSEILSPVVIASQCVISARSLRITSSAGYVRPASTFASPSRIAVMESWRWRSLRAPIYRVRLPMWPVFNQEFRRRQLEIPVWSTESRAETRVSGCHLVWIGEGLSLAILLRLTQNDAVSSIAVRTGRLPGWLKKLQQKRD